MSQSYKLCNKDVQLFEDLLQDAYIKIFENIHQVNLENFSSKSFYGWCNRVLTNIVYDYYRKQKRNPTDSIEDVIDKVSANTETIKSDYFEHKQFDYEDIINATNSLTPRYKLVFEMYLIDGYSHKEIAEQLNIGEGTSKSNLHKAKHNVKKELEGMLKVNL